MHELSEQFVGLLTDSVLQIRRIRSRGLSAIGTTAEAQKVNNTLDDARTLGKITAQACVDYVLDGKDTLVPEWQELITFYQERDKAVPQISKMFINGFESDINRYAAFATMYDEKHLIDYLLRKNYIGTIDDIYMYQPKQLGVFAPLSYDYTCALYLSELYRRTHGICNFDVEPVLMDMTGKIVRLPTQATGEPSFADKSALTFFIDAHETGKTKQALLPALISQYPHHTVIS